VLDDFGLHSDDGGCDARDCCSDCGAT